MRVILKKEDEYGKEDERNIKKRGWEKCEVMKYGKEDERNIKKGWWEKYEVWSMERRMREILRKKDE